MRYRKTVATLATVATMAIGSAVVAVLRLLPAANAAAGPEQVVRIVAQRFMYTPSEIVLRTGQPAVLEFQSLDFTHGFNIPDLKIRADLPPGQITRVRLTPQKAGVYDFLCDNFCGIGHEQMNGKIIVRD